MVTQGQEDDTWTQKVAATAVYPQGDRYVDVNVLLFCPYRQEPISRTEA